MEEGASEGAGRPDPAGCCIGAAALGLLVVVAPLWLLWGASHVEVAGVARPGGGEAVLVETNGGATTSFGYSVRLRQSGWFGSEREVASLYAARRRDCAYGVNLRWEGRRRLLIEYEDARSAAIYPERLSGRDLAVELRPGTVDPHAPCGAMEYNLRPRSR